VSEPTVLWASVYDGGSALQVHGDDLILWLEKDGTAPVGLRLNPAEARKLGEALVAWAKKEAE
jgi:hypothetical protein